MNSATIVQKLWNYCNVLRCGTYVEKLNCLNFLKMADARIRPPNSQASLEAIACAWMGPMTLSRNLIGGTR